MGLGSVGNSSTRKHSSIASSRATLASIGMGCISIAVKVIGILRGREWGKIWRMHQLGLGIGWEARVFGGLSVGKAPSFGVTKVASNLFEEPVM